MEALAESQKKFVGEWGLEIFYIFREQFSKPVIVERNFSGQLETTRNELCLVIVSQRNKKKKGLCLVVSLGNKKN